MRGQLPSEPDLFLRLALNAFTTAEVALWAWQSHEAPARVNLVLDQMATTRSLRELIAVLRRVLGDDPSMVM